MNVPAAAQGALAFDWGLEVGTQRQTMTEQLRASGVAAPLVESADAYVEEAGDLTSEPVTFLHGDLSGFNFTVKREGGRLEVPGLLTSATRPSAPSTPSTSRL